MTTAPTPLLLPDGSPAATAWPLSAGVLHLNHGSFGAVPIAALEYQAQQKALMESDPVAWFVELTGRVRDERVALSTWLGSPADATVLVPNASAGATIIYNSIPVSPGLEVIVTNHGYGAVTMGAERLVKRWGGRLVTVNIPLAATEDEAFKLIAAAITDRTRLIVLDQVTSATARRMPVAKVVNHARERSVLTLIDGAHVPGLHTNIFEDFTPDFWVGNLHKFPCAPRGAALLVCQSDINDEIYPLIDSWGYPKPFPERFDVQGTLDQTSYLAARRSIEFIENTWGWTNAITYMSDLAAYGQQVIRSAFEDLTGEDHAAVVGMEANALKLIKLPASMARNHPEADALRDRFVRENPAEAAFTSFEGTGYLRISAHIYNTPAEYEQFAEQFVPRLVAWSREVN